MKVRAKFPSLWEAKTEEEGEDEDEIKMDWYILKVQSNRENSICDALKTPSRGPKG